MTEKPHPASRYESYSHEAMRAEVETGSDPAAAGELGREWTDLAARLRDAGDVLEQTSAASEEAWRGPAGEALRGVLGRAARWSAEVAAAATTVGEAVGRQAEVAAKARAEMPEPVGYDPAGMIRAAANSGQVWRLVGLSDAMAAQRERAEAARQQAVDVMYARDSALADELPAVSFDDPPPLTALSPLGAEGSGPM
ncbi:hypothetical protein FHU38_003143 [Saccharomonospora amisosensis]|uniref:PPE family protein n=1 Tax=Saccharomonospora amisosensis TaxID=1128677 RepID=A0A7X5URC6_9PSEU|nr:PE-PGRS family protein [Saccharomonospora amisosensis]NIJ12799.1 hypothetical protein [Saccharomonospora amisosensis]